VLRIAKPLALPVAVISTGVFGLLDRRGPGAMAKGTSSIAAQSAGEFGAETRCCQGLG
jgi:hypothetical protein